MCAFIVKLITGKKSCVQSTSPWGAPLTPGTDNEPKGTAFKPEFGTLGSKEPNRRSQISGI